MAHGCLIQELKPRNKVCQIVVSQTSVASCSTLAAYHEGNHWCLQLNSASLSSRVSVQFDTHGSPRSFHLPLLMRGIPNIADGRDVQTRESATLTYLRVNARLIDQLYLEKSAPLGIRVKRQARASCCGARGKPLAEAGIGRTRKAVGWYLPF